MGKLSSFAALPLILPHVFGYIHVIPQSEGGGLEGQVLARDPCNGKLNHVSTADKILNVIKVKKLISFLFLLKDNKSILTHKML